MSLAKKLSLDTFKPNEVFPNAPESMWMPNQQKWIQSQIESGKPIYDIGINRGRIAPSTSQLEKDYMYARGLAENRSPYYDIERTTLKSSGYSREFRNYVKVDVQNLYTGQLELKQFRLYEWIKR